MPIELSKYLDVFADEARGHLQALNQVLLELEKTPGNLELVNVMFRSAHTLKGMAATMGFSELAELTHRMENLLSPIRRGELACTPQTVELLFTCLDALQAMVDACVAQEQHAVPAATAVAPQPAGGPMQPPERPRVSARAAQTIRVDPGRLDALLDLVGELAAGKTRLALLAGELRRTELTDTLEQFGHIISELHSAVLQTRMVPIETVFNRFPRMIRDLAQARGKQIELMLTGGATELDRAMLDEIGEPLVHLIRNALDHGIETPAERAAAGKPPAGTLALAAFLEGSHVLIQIRDDGRGIDPERIRRAAVRQGLITQEQAGALTREQALELIFAAGLSTMEQVTDISGRGVGMDVVRHKLDQLDGEIKVASELGAGSTFTIKLPLTLAIVQALLVQVAAVNYAIPQDCIEDTLHIQPESILRLDQRDVIRLRGGILPLIHLRQLLHGTDAPRAAGDVCVVVVRGGRGPAGLCVDATLGMSAIVLRSLGHNLPHTRYIAGGTIMGDGTVARVLDIAQIAP